MATIAGLAAAVLLGAVSQGVTLPGWAVERIEARINGAARAEAAALGTLDLGDVALDYDFGTRALRLSLREAGLRGSAGEAPRLRLPRLDVGLDAGALLSGRLRPRDLSLAGATLRVARDAEGRLDLSLGGGGGAVALPQGWPEALAALDALLAWPPLADLDAIEATGIAVAYADARSGAAQELREGRITLRRGAGGGALSAEALLPVPGAPPARVSLGLDRDAQGARARFAVEGLPLGRVAELLPEAPALSLVAGEVALSAEMSVDARGAPGPLRGTATLAQGRVALARPVPFDRARLAFAWQPGSGLVAIEDLSLGAEALASSGAGQLLLEDGLRGAVQLQLALGGTVLAPEGVWPRDALFDGGLIEARLTQRPLALRLGQLSLRGPSGAARASGRFRLAPEGVEGALDARADGIDLAQVMALWPLGAAPRTRDWASRNLISGRARGASAAVRLRPGARPRIAVGFAIEDATVRFLRDMPPVEGARGWFELHDDRMSVRVDAGTVPGLTLAAGPVEGGPEGQAGGAAARAGRVDMAGTRFTVLDTRARPARARLDLVAEGAAGDVLRLIDNPPLRLMSRAGRGPDLARGRARIDALVEMPLKRGTAPAEIAYRVEGVLSDLTSDALVPGRTLAAERLALTVTPQAARVAGALSLSGVPARAEWVQPLPPPRAGPPDPDAPPRPMPQARVTGTAEVTEAGLARLGVSLGAVEMSGAAQAAFEVVLGGGPPRLSVASDLRGAGLALPAVGWRKPAATGGRLTLEATLGRPAAVEALEISAPGLSASGRVTLAQGGGLGRARLDAVDLGWFRGAVTLTGRGAGRAPAVAVTGGRADLRRALPRLGGGGGGGGGGGPVTLSLDRLTVTDGIELSDLRAELSTGGGPSGRFTARLNALQPVEGTLGPAGGGTGLEMRSADMGAVLRAAGLFADARGGQGMLTLRPTGRAGVYDGTLRATGLRIANSSNLARLLQAASVGGLIDQLTGAGVLFETVAAEFAFLPGAGIRLGRASAVGPQLSVTAEGAYDLRSRRIDLEGVLSPLGAVNRLLGAVLGPRPDEGLIGFTYRLTGEVGAPRVSVNPLSALTPGVFREIFRRAPPAARD
jgi:hypothetical protein